MTLSDLEWLNEIFSDTKRRAVSLRQLSVLSYSMQCRFTFLCQLSFNPLECKGNYSATSNNIKLVHWSLMGGLLHPGPSSLYQMYQPTHHRPVYQSPYSCMMVRCSSVLMCLLKGFKPSFCLKLQFILSFKQAYRTRCDKPPPSPPGAAT